jgi:acyl dehydratase
MSYQARTLPQTIQVGDTLPERVFGPISRTDIVKYQGASGDFNPIHHDESFAKSAGFPTVFSVGMLQASYLATYVTDLLGPDSVRRFRTRFREQVWPGDELTCTGTVTALRTDEDSGEKVADLELTVTRQTGGVAIQGWATFAV